ncbi:ribose-5-phosphate isomerase RpiA [Segetibacter sp. 3557_3]|uniref:ribose-5-phosphate isomerase RpiA n=1 Tax=Segetibacter sp. 3557_3 TaxID=2547429 RepID=UPI001058C1B4|nr:ribose-5-phosphate isomerase RpiA [Segetibacter sp. 3557_3]TDH21245.1 ribose-5-phosphate isomerase RpiA [Segetibacter sp. 3557_3]
MSTDRDHEKYLAAKEAVKYVSNNQVVGLGTGSTAFFAIQEIGRLVSEGLSVRCVPTSNRTKELAESLHIPLVDINEVESIDVTIDGADEFTTQLRLIKGGGGALLREKIVASLTRRQIIIVDSTKKVDVLGRFPLPVEVVPFASQYVLRQLKQKNGVGKIRMADTQPYLTDQGNQIIDTDFGQIADPVKLSIALKSIEGVVGHGLFINLAHKVIMGVAASGSTITYE